MPGPPSLWDPRSSGSVMLRGAPTFGPPDWDFLTSTVELLHCPHNGTEVPCNPAVIPPFVQLDTLHEWTVASFSSTGLLSVIYYRGLLHHGESPGPLAAVPHVRRLRQATQFQEQFPKPLPLVQFHVHKFKCHRLGPGAAHDCLRPDVAD